jgi:hypothetical protein
MRHSSLACWDMGCIVLKWNRIVNYDEKLILRDAHGTLSGMLHALGQEGCALTPKMTSDDDSPSKCCDRQVKICNS